MNNEQKHSLVTLIANIAIMAINGLIAIFTPATQKVAMDIIGGLFNA